MGRGRGFESCPSLALPDTASMVTMAPLCLAGLCLCLLFIFSSAHSQIVTSRGRRADPISIFSSANSTRPPSPLLQNYLLLRNHSEEKLNKLRSQPQTPLHWKPEHAGAFSLFLQLKLAVRSARLHNRTLWIGPATSRHYRSELRLCDWFDLPQDVRCVDASVAGHFPCQLKSAFILADPICYDPRQEAQQRNREFRAHMIYAVNLTTLRYTPHPAYLPLIHLYQATLAKQYKVIRTSFSYLTS
jgi:hypothetical protein